MTWADQFKAARGSLTQREAAAAIYSGRDITRTVQDWELGRNSPPDWVQPLVLGVLAVAVGRKNRRTKKGKKPNAKVADEKRRGGPTDAH